MWRARCSARKNSHVTTTEEKYWNESAKNFIDANRVNTRARTIGLIQQKIWENQANATANESSTPHFVFFPEIMYEEQPENVTKRGVSKQLMSTISPEVIAFILEKD